MSYLDRYSDSIFDVEEALQELEEYNNLYEASKEEVDALLKKGQQSYDQKINTSVGKQTLHLRNMANRKAIVKDAVDKADQNLSDASNYYGTYDDTLAKDVIRTIDSKYAQQIREIEEKKILLREQYESDKRRYSHFPDRIVVINQEYKNKMGRFNDEIAALRKQQREEKKGRLTKFGRKKIWKAEAQEALKPYVKSKDELKKRYKEIKDTDKVEYSAKNQHTMTKPNGENSYSQYELRSIKAGLKDQQAQNAEQKQKNITAQAEKIGLGKKAEQGQLSRKEYYKAKYGDMLKNKKDERTKIQEQVTKKFPEHVQQPANSVEQRAQQLKDVIAYQKEYISKMKDADPMKAMKVKRAMGDNEANLKFLTDNGAIYKRIQTMEKHIADVKKDNSLTPEAKAYHIQKMRNHIAELKAHIK